MSILIVGGTGYLGSKLISNLAKQGETLHCWIRETSNITRLKGLEERLNFYSGGVQNLYDYITNNKINTIVYMACVYETQHNHSDVIETNLNLPLQILDISSNFKEMKFICIGTSLPSNVNLYAMSKQKFGEFGKYYCEQYDGFSFYNILLESFYGDDEPENRFISRCINLLIRNKDIDLTSGNQHRDYIHISDVINGIMTILSFNQAGYYEFGLGSGDSPTIKEMLLYLKDITNSSSNLNFGKMESRKNEPDCCANLDELKKLGFEAKIDWETGFKNMVDYLKR